MILLKQYTAEELKGMRKEEIIALLMQAQKQNALFMEQLAVMQADRFGRKTEKMGCLGQLSLLNEAEAESEAEEPEIEEVVQIRKKRPKGKLEQDLAGFPVRVESHELSEAELAAVFGENDWKRLPDEIYRDLEYHPATQEVVEHHIAVYAAKNDDHIERAPHPAELLVHSIATPSWWRRS